MAVTDRVGPLAGGSGPIGVRRRHCNEQPRINGELQGKLTMLDVACHRCERRGRVSLARLIEEHGADTGLPDLWESLAGDCQHARSTAVHNRCAIYYPQLSALFLPSKQA